MSNKLAGITAPCLIAHSPPPIGAMLMLHAEYSKGLRQVAIFSPILVIRGLGLFDGEMDRDK